MSIASPLVYSKKIGTLAETDTRRMYEGVRLRRLYIVWDEISCRQLEKCLSRSWNNKIVIYELPLLLYDKLLLLQSTLE